MLDLIAEKTCLLLFQLSEEETKIVSPEIENNKSHFIVKSYDKVLSEKELKNIKSETFLSKKPTTRKSSL